MVLLNATAGLVVLGNVEDLKHGAALAAEAIDSGKARECLARLAKASEGEPPQ